jgi:hypothetical protein
MCSIAQGSVYWLVFVGASRRLLSVVAQIVSEQRLQCDH